MADADVQLDNLHGRHRAMMLNGPSPGPTRDGLQGFHGTPGPREQTVLTPEFLLAPLRTVWGGIVYDPCAAPEGPVWVACDYCKGTGTKKNGKPCCDAPHGGWYEQTVNAEIECRLPVDGLAESWIDASFCNPEFAKLKQWLFPPIEPDARVAWLVPVRPHRKWWREWARTVMVIYLNPFAFVGHKQSFPAPMCIGYRGPEIEAIKQLYRKHGETI